MFSRSNHDHQDSRPATPGIRRTHSQASLSQASLSSEQSGNGEDEAETSDAHQAKRRREQSPSLSQTDLQFTPADTAPALPADTTNDAPGHPVHHLKLLEALLGSALATISPLGPTQYSPQVVSAVQALTSHITPKPQDTPEAVVHHAHTPPNIPAPSAATEKSTYAQAVQQTATSRPSAQKPTHNGTAVRA